MNIKGLGIGEIDLNGNENQYACQGRVECEIICLDLEHA